MYVAFLLLRFFFYDYFTHDTHTLPFGNVLPNATFLIRIRVVSREDTRAQRLCKAQHIHVTSIHGHGTALRNSLV